ncbi:GbsR/MarR family transcriptional regulator [Nocardia mangyaensis]|uniref:GbsR/MarR family transcriptional regulator n=1 Tax=Nocardia mangyaensis TaxID=2213200 RepID=UPI0026771CA9|nr:helix-turn-helix domain-containing protein [Nocardia mangyaensis]MDO3646479.1 helix-turn-helix domain-containing protein [Nocardia mangyaensis]
MPGGRLTLHERECIAAGLADGLGYTEIGRQLERPTSTVSREVTRNGGPSRYRADRAHRATMARARRSRATAQPPVPATAPDEAVRDFAAHFTDLFVYDGMPRMQARVLTCLHLTDSGSLTAAELARQLDVSPASISTAVNALESRDLLRRERDSRRRDHYYIDGDTWYRTTLNLARAAEERVKAARHGAELLGVSTPAGARLHEIGRYLDYLGQQMVLVVERWHRP